MSIPMIASTDTLVQAERWRQWQLAYTDGSRRSETRMRIVFTVVLTALAIALGVQFLSM